MSEFTVLDLLDLDLKEHNHLQLKCIAGRSGLSRAITSAKIGRPGLALAGYFIDFSWESIQLFGRGEQSYLAMLEKNNDWINIEKLFEYNMPCIIFTGGAKPGEHFTDLAEKHATAVLTTPFESGEFSLKAYQMLDEVFAETETRHAVLVEVFGIGILITGESGIGKSEAALELIERGHRLVSDDTVRLRRISDNYIIGTGENPHLAHHMEIRGLGIINLQDLFGVGAIREKKQVQLLIHLEKWDEKKKYDRLGKGEVEEIMGIPLPKLTLPVGVGRNVASLIETAARNERLKKLGYHSADQFDQSVLKWIESQTARKLYSQADKD